MDRSTSIELARQQHREDAVLGSDQFVIVELNASVFAISLGDVLEVEQIPSIALAPGARPWIEGVVNLRGSVLTLVDLAQLLGMPARQKTNAARMLVVSREDPVALAVDRLRGMRRLTHPIRSPIIEHLPGTASRYCSGLYRQDGEYVAALDVLRLLDDEGGEESTIAHLRTPDTLPQFASSERV